MYIRFLENADALIGQSNLCEKSELQAVLVKYGISDLLEKFMKAKINKKIVWLLNDELLAEIDLTGIEKMRYHCAKQTWEKEERKECPGKNYYLVNK